MTDCYFIPPHRCNCIADCIVGKHAARKGVSCKELETWFPEEIQNINSFRAESGLPPLVKVTQVKRRKKEVAKDEAHYLNTAAKRWIMRRFTAVI